MRPRRVSPGTTDFLLILKKISANETLTGITTDEEASHLQDSLKRDDAVARLYLRYMNLDLALAAHASSSDLMREMLLLPSQGEAWRWASWFPWRLLTAVVAGIAFGILCTSMVFGFVSPSLGKVVTLLDDSFESGPAPLLTGVPIEPERWSGDYSEVVGEQLGVKPESGRKMLRFLRGDYEGKPNPEGSKIGDMYRLIDMRPYRKEFADGGAVLQFSAGFNAFAFPEKEKYRFKMSIHAFDAETATKGSWRVGNTLAADELAGAGAGRIKLDRNPATWQRMTGDLRLPGNTDFLLIHIAIEYPGNHRRRKLSPDTTSMRCDSRWHTGTCCLEAPKTFPSDETQNDTCHCPRHDSHKRRGTPARCGHCVRPGIQG